MHCTETYIPPAVDLWKFDTRFLIDLVQGFQKYAGKLIFHNGSLRSNLCPYTSALKKAIMVS